MNADTKAERERLARVYLLTVTRSGERDVSDLVLQYGPALAAELIAASNGGAWEEEATAALEQCRKAELRLVVPGDDEWPAALAKDPWTAPLGLWVWGRGRLNELCMRVVGVAGRTDATPYGITAAAEIGRQVARAGWTVVTLGRPGIDSAALRGAVQVRAPGTLGRHDVLGDRPAAEAASPLVLPFGRLLDPQPLAHVELFRRVGWAGALAGEHGPNVPKRHGRPDVRRQLRLLASLSTALVVVEPNGQGWDSRLVRAVEDANRPVLTIPGPINCEQSEFAHELFRTARARLVTGPDQVLSELDRSHR